MTDRAKCFDKKTAEYFASGRRKKVQSFRDDDYKGFRRFYYSSPFIEGLMKIKKRRNNTYEDRR